MIIHLLISLVFDQLSKFKLDIDSVTIHDYSGYDGSASAADQKCTL